MASKVFLKARPRLSVFKLVIWSYSLYAELQEHVMDAGARDGRLNSFACIIWLP